MNFHGRQIQLHLGGSDLINSVGISYLFEVLEHLVELKGQMALCCVDPTIAKTLRIMGMLNEAALYDTEQVFG
jgi:anti-anti-sigma factor